MTKRALIVINMIQDYFLPKGALFLGPRGRKMIPDAVELVDEFRRNKELIVFTADAHQGHDGEFKVLPRHGLRGSWGAQAIEELSPFPGEHNVPKRYYDATFSSTLPDVLKRNHVTETHLIGVTTSLDYFATASSLFYHGFQLVIYPKRTADLNEKDRKNALDLLKAKFGARVA